MRFRTKALYLGHAVLCSCSEILFAAVLFGVACVWTSHLSKDVLGSQGYAIVIGVLSSIIATLLVNVSGKYSESCHAHVNIVHRAMEMSEWVRNQKDYFCSNHKMKTEHSFYLVQYYMNMCNESCRLTYKNDFDEFSLKVSTFIEALNERIPDNEFDDFVEDFDTAVESFNVGCND